MISWESDERIIQFIAGDIFFVVELHSFAWSMRDYFREKKLKFLGEHQFDEMKENLP
jgi:hypothetical protein